MLYKSTDACFCGNKRIFCSYLQAHQPLFSKLKHQSCKHLHKFKKGNSFFFRTCRMLLFLLIVLILTLIVISFISQPQFGKLPSGDRLRRITQSPHFSNGKFQNLTFTPDLTNGATYYSVMKEILFSKTERLRPTSPIPSIKTDLNALRMEDDVLVWLGHSAYYLQVDGKRILVDPVFSGSASPLPGGTKAFAGADIYKTTDIPKIDLLFISHDHWDHLDYQTVKKLRPQIGEVICPLGVGEHLEYWGYDKNILHEKDWNQEIDLGNGFSVTVVTARHFSGRSFLRNKALWASFVLRTPTMKIFLGGDSGYDTHFADIGNRFGPFDLAILENGQYDLNWQHIHLMPGEFLQAAADLKARNVLPVHSAKFKLGNHAWDEPLQKLSMQRSIPGIRVITPMIGEPVLLKDESQPFSPWWQSVK